MGFRTPSPCSPLPPPPAVPSLKKMSAQPVPSFQSEHCMKEAFIAIRFDSPPERMFGQ